MIQNTLNQCSWKNTVLSDAHWEKNPFWDDLVNYFAYLWPKMKRKSKKPCHYSLCSQFITEYSSVPLLIKPLPDILLCSGLLKKPLVKMMLPTLNHHSLLQTSELTAVFSPVYPSWFVILNISCFAWNKIPWLFKRHMGYSIFIMEKNPKQLLLLIIFHCAQAGVYPADPSSAAFC